MESSISTTGIFGRGPAHPAAARRMTKFVMLVLATLAIAACHGPPPLVALEAGPQLRLVAAPGVRINARLKPALELDDGSVLRFDSPRMTPDSAYFAAPPVAAP